MPSERACLAWGRAGSRTPRHIHRGDENMDCLCYVVYYGALEMLEDAAG